MITFMPAVPIRGELGSLYQLYSISKHTFHQTLFLRLRRPVLRLRRLSGLSDRPALLFNFKTTTFIIKGTNSTCTTSQQLQQSGTNYGSREAAIHSFEEDSEFPVYSRRIKSLQRQSLVIAITKLIIENYYYYYWSAVQCLRFFTMCTLAPLSSSHELIPNLLGPSSLTHPI